MILPIRRALLSVSDKSGLVELARALAMEPRMLLLEHAESSFDPGASARDLGPAYTSPTTGAWATPGPTKGPFKAKLRDGSFQFVGLACGDAHACAFSD